MVIVVTWKGNQMAPRRTLDPETAQRMKADMFEGMKNDELQSKYGMGYQSLVNVKSGRQYGDIPWPDGTYGQMPHMRAAAIRQDRKFNTKMSHNAAHGGYIPPEEDDMWSLHLKRKGIPLDTPSPLNNGNTLLYDLRYGWPHLIPAVQRWTGIIY
jgi:hypothetical protein